MEKITFKYTKDNTISYFDEFEYNNDILSIFKYFIFLDHIGIPQERFDEIYSNLKNPIKMFSSFEEFKENLNDESFQLFLYHSLCDGN